MVEASVKVSVSMVSTVDDCVVGLVEVVVTLVVVVGVDDEAVGGGEVGQSMMFLLSDVTLSDVIGGHSESDEESQSYRIRTVKLRREMTQCSKHLL